MDNRPRQITLDEWDARHAELVRGGLVEPAYGGPISRHVIEGGDLRLAKLRFDNSPAALRLWNFLLTEEDRLRQARAEGKKLVGVMKDLGTSAALAWCFDNLAAFYPDGAWWIPCVMELSDGLFHIADSLGFDESFCPVRAMLGAFVTGAHFPLPDLLVCSAGAVCDDFSAIAQRLASLGQPILWWEVPHRTAPDADEEAVELPGGLRGRSEQVAAVRAELERVRSALENLAGRPLTDDDLARGIAETNKVRRLLAELRRLAYSAEPCPMPALEMLIAEMLAIHFCSDRDESQVVLGELLAEVRRRADAGTGPFPAGLARVFWVNPVADLRAMNLLEECGGRICGTEYLFAHALDEIPQDVEPMEALARSALADPMVGSARERAGRICRDAAELGSEAVVISRIPGASHCALEGAVIAQAVRRLGLPVLEIEVPPVSESVRTSLQTRLQALVETVLARRNTAR